MGLAYSYFFFCFNMLELLFINRTLLAVKTAITSSYKQLLWTLLLLLVIVWIFSLLGFYFMRILFDTNENQILKQPVFVIDWFFYLLTQLLVDGSSTIDTCTMTDALSSSMFRVLWLRYRNEDYWASTVTDEASLEWERREELLDGVSCTMDTDHYNTKLMKMFFELLFSVTMLIVLMQMVFGIIIDTFGSLREQQSEVQTQKRNYCFICGIEKRRFELEALKDRHTNNGFLGHIHDEHSIWDYFFYYCYLQEKPTLDYTGVDTFIAAAVERGNMEWLPVNKSISLQTKDENEQSVQQQLIALKYQLRALDRNDSYSSAEIDKCLRNQEAIIAMLGEQQQQLQSQQHPQQQQQAPLGTVPGRQRSPSFSTVPGRHRSPSGTPPVLSNAAPSMLPLVMMPTRGVSAPATASSILQPGMGRRRSVTSPGPPD
jgi:hypothetical protein